MDMANGLRSDANKLSKVSDGYNKQSRGYR